MTDAPSPPSYLDDFPRGRQTAGSDASFLHPAPSSTQDAQDESQYEGLMTVHNRASYHYPDSRDGKASNRLRAFVSAAAVSFGLAALALIVCEQFVQISTPSKVLMALFTVNVEQLEPEGHLSQLQHRPNRRSQPSMPRHLCRTRM